MLDELGVIISIYQIRDDAKDVRVPCDVTDQQKRACNNARGSRPNATLPVVNLIYTKRPMNDMNGFSQLLLWLIEWYTKTSLLKCFLLCEFYWQFYDVSPSLCFANSRAVINFN